jgi:hypothetical protein
MEELAQTTVRICRGQLLTGDAEVECGAELHKLPMEEWLWFRRRLKTRDAANNDQIVMIAAETL